MTDLTFGLGITGIGMGLVFGVLALLWGALTLLGKLDLVLGLAPAGAQVPGAVPVVPAPGGPVLIVSGEVEPEALAAIAIAVQTHATLLRREAAPVQRSSKPGAQLFASRWLAAGRTRQTRSFSRGR